MQYSSSALGPDTTFSAHNTVITAAAAKAVRRLRRGGTLDAMGQRALIQGAELLDNIIQGSIYVENADVGGLTRPTSTEDVLAYSHALTVLQDLKLAERDQLSEAFKQIRDAVSRLAAGAYSELPTDRLDAIERFFNTLNQVFYTDIYNGLLPVRQKDEVTTSEGGL